MSNEFDAIVIGSGMGGLTVASILATVGKKRVLVLERHFRAGGFTHEFNRKKYHWDVGVHYIGDLAETSMLRRLFDVITGSQVKWQKMEEPFEMFVYPDFSFPVYGDPERFIGDVVAMFPDEEPAIRRYLEDVKKAAAWFGRHVTMKSLPPFLDGLTHLLDSLGQKSALMTTGEYLNLHFKNEKLKALLLSQWGDYGLPPAESTFVIHSLIVTHYLNGGYYPVGGAGKIAESVEAILNANGGEIRVSHEVTEVIVEEGKAVGVRVKKLPERPDSNIEFRAPLIVSDAGAWTTFMRLVPESVSLPFRSDLDEFYKQQPVTTNVTLYLGLKEDPRKQGFHGENYWIYSTYDHDKNYLNRSKWVEESNPTGAYLSFPSLKNPESQSHTAEIIAFADYKTFEPWKGGAWKKRGMEYADLKEKIAQLLIAYIEKHLPGFKDNVEFYELSTPITNEHFTAHPLGSIYGLACVPDRFRESKASFSRARTPVPGLFLTGADVSSPGVAGAMMGGFATLAHLINGFSILSLFRRPR
ncbi:MAG: NAD(P)/FAD-dependent oxidoreductase [Leptospirales bacterium]|nr:NAD(P)/FAD-dependent oxidoreductase [Leptospirales bacterium]